MQSNSDLYEKVIPLAHLGIWERNLDTGEVYWNHEAREIYELEPGFYPTLDQIFAFYNDQEALKTLFEKAISTGQPERGEFLLRTGKGNLKWIKLRMHSAITAENQRMIYGTIKDISNQKRLIDALAEREQQFHHAFEYAPIGMALVSPTGAWIKVNKMLTDMLGYDRGELLARTFQDITYPDDLDLDLQQMAALLDGQTASYVMEKRYYHADGRIIWVLLSVTLVRDTQNQPLYLVSHLKDITEQKSVELERDYALKVIQAQNSRLLNFAHMVSHNLRSHAGNIEMLTNMIAEEKDLSERESMIGLLGINAVNLRETLEHLNEVVNVEGQTGQQLKKLNILNEIKKVKSVLSESLRLASGKLVINVAQDMEITCDQAYLESILLNLLSNSIKYRKVHRNLVITVTGRREENHVVIQIADNGLGIDLYKHGEKLFGMYNTFHGNNDAQGIGLFLVKNQVEAMDGTIKVTSEPGIGTSFEVGLPYRAEQEHKLKVSQEG